jgi:hypothetical protein
MAAKQTPQKLAELLAKAKSLAPGDDAGLKTLLEDALATPVTDAQYEMVVEAAKKKTGLTAKTARGLADKAKAEAAKRKSNSPDAIEAARQAKEWEKEAARREREAERGRLLRRCSSIAMSKTLLADMVSIVQRLGVVGEGPSIRGMYLTMTSRLLKDAISLLRRGAAAGGKNYPILVILRIIPQESVISISSSSPMALIYYGDDENALAHKIIVIAEAAAIATKANGDESPMTIMLRTLLSEGYINRVVAVPQPDGATKTIHVLRKGPVCLVLTSARDNVEAEMLTRLVTSDADESDEQTRQILSKILSGKHEEVSEEEIGQWLDFQRLLELDMPDGGYAVAIPFECALLKAWLDLLKGDPTALQLRIRRDATALRAAIEASAVLHKEQRQTDGSERIVAELDDYKNAFDAFNDGLAALYDLKPAVAVVRALNTVVEMAQEQATAQDVEGEIRDGASYKISAEDLRKRAGYPSKATAYSRLDKLVDLGALERDEAMRGHGRGAPSHYKLKKMSLAGAAGNILPLVGEVKMAWEGGERNEQNERNERNADEAENFEGGGGRGSEVNGMDQPIDFKATTIPFTYKPEIRTVRTVQNSQKYVNGIIGPTEIRGFREPFTSTPLPHAASKNSVPSPPEAKSPSFSAPVCEVIGPARPGQRCAICNGSLAAKRVRLNGVERVWHPACADRYLAAMPAGGPEDIVAEARGRGASFDLSADGSVFTPILTGVRDPAVTAALFDAIGVNRDAILDLLRREASQ